ncbi:MAG TPA: hypothetical protein DCS55_03485, partial [Acidimicrobiaceae bacterium]|nr:hypothetical protein [Acidimicrobiaceae bacterium]
MSHPPDRFRYRASEPPRPPRRPPGGLRAERHRPRARRRLLSEARELHADQMVRVRAIDEVIEGLVDERLACLDVLVDCRDQLRPRWGRRHSRRRSSVDEAPFPEAPQAARPVEGVGLRSVALTILRRHGPQRLRDLHGLIHLYGYRIESVRPVQRLGDAMAYELRQGRVIRLERGVYEAAEPHPGPSRYVPPDAELGDVLPWDRPITDPGPPHVDPDVATDPELWSGAAWPTDEDIPPGPNEGPRPDPEPMHGGAADLEAADREPEPDPTPGRDPDPDRATPT